MRKKTDLHICFFNEFVISSPNYEYAPSTHNSTQLTLLISYLVANQDTKVPKDELMAMLWPDIQDKVPVGALRNLIYRARKELQSLYPDQAIDYIKFTQDAYYWNPDLNCKIDIIDFENYYNLALQETDSVKQYHYYYRMQRLYTGAFLSNHQSVEWVEYRCTYYRNMYINCMLNMCEYLNSNSRYEELISLCDQSIIIYPEEERFYRYKLLSYIGMNRIKSALEYYRTTLNIFSSRYCIDISASLHSIYQELLAHTPTEELKLDELEATLQTGHDTNKTFYCDFNLFKNIYELNMRSVRRVHGRYYLLLLTLLSTDQTDLDPKKQSTAMDTLYDLLANSLRKNDVYTRASLNQYSAILLVKDDTNIETIKAHIIDGFDKVNTDTNISLDICERILG